MMELLKQFADVNKKEIVDNLKDEEHLKYNKYGLEAVKETIARHKQGRFDEKTTIEREGGGSSGGSTILFKS